MRPERPDDPHLYAKLVDPKTGPEFAVGHVVAPIIRDSYADLREAARGADLLISTALSFATPLLAEKEGLPFVSGTLQPIGLFSIHDLPLFPGAEPLVAVLRKLGPLAGRAFRTFARAAARSWTDPVRALRRELGLPMPGPDPLWEGQHSPHLVLAMFPRTLAQPQPDWPRQTHVTGALFWDQPSTLPPDLAQFLAAGPAPIVFTLGSTAVNAAGRFYAESLAAAQVLNRRAVLLVGSDPVNRANLPNPLPPWAIAVDYAPHAQVFPKAAAIVHQGGVGTLAQAMRAGRPMLVVPFSHDQPDNAARVQRLGIARAIPAAKYNAASAARELRQLLGDPRMATRAQEIARDVQAESGVTQACDLIEALLAATAARPRSSPPAAPS